MAKEAAVRKGQVYSGQYTKLVFDVVDEDNGDIPLDCTSFTITWVLKSHESDADGIALLTKTTGAGITVGDGDGTGSRVTVTLQAADTANMVEDTYYHALGRTDQKTLLAAGPFFVTQAALHS